MKNPIRQSGSRYLAENKIPETNLRFGGSATIDIIANTTKYNFRKHQERVEI